MRHRQFLYFFLPSALVMLLFIAVPILFVAYQSLFVEHEQVMKSVENCGPFGCQQEIHVDTEAMALLKEAAPMGQFNALGTYTNASHLAVDELKTIWHNRTNLGTALSQTLNLPFYKALGFTLAYTAIVTPLAILAGFVIALAVNTLPARIKGTVIF